jgi:hypothetical protein
MMELKMSKRVLSYAAYISKISDSEIIIVNVVEANKDLSSDVFLPSVITYSLSLDATFKFYN